jgi:hypothetical protein
MFQAQALPSFSQNQQPLFQARQPLFQAQQPLFQAQQPLFQAQQPLFQAQQPLFQAQQPLFQAQTAPVLVRPVTINPILQSTKNNFVPFIAQNPLNPLGAMIGTYQDLDLDKDIQKKVSKHFYKKLCTKWLYDNNSLLAFIKLDNGKPELIKSMNEYNQQSIKGDTVSNIEKKISYMESKLISYKDIKHFLKKFISRHSYHWYTLYTIEDKIKEELSKYLKNLLEEAIKEAGH